MLGRKWRSGTSKTKKLLPVQLGFPLFWKSHCVFASQHNLFRTMWPDRALNHVSVELFPCIKTFFYFNKFSMAASHSCENTLLRHKFVLSDSFGKFPLTYRLVAKRSCHVSYYIWHLMSGPEGNIEILGKQNSLFPKGPVIKWFVIVAKQNKSKYWKTR